MGMFDEVRCDYPLPDGFDPAGRWFQTKDTPDQYLTQYILTADGRLQCAATEELVPFHGALRFYTTNIAGSSPRGCITSDNAAPWWAEYCALFDHGRLLKLEGHKAPYTEHPHISREVFFRS